MSMKHSIIKSAVFFILLAGVQVSVKAQSNVIDEVIWIVGDDAILLSDVENQKIWAQANNEKLPDNANCVIPEQIAVNKLFLHQAKRDSIVVSAARVDAEVNQWINYVISRVGSKEKMEEYFNKPLSQIRDEKTESIHEQLVVQQVQQKLLSNIKATPSDVRSFYRSIPADSLPIVPATVEVQIITNNPVIPQSEIDEIKARLRGYADRVNSGEIQFSTLARLYSDDKGSANNGGELGFNGRGQLVPEFADVAFSLSDPTKVSRVVETEYGFHIMQFIAKDGDRVNVRHILLIPKVSLDAENTALHQLDSLANQIRTSKITFEQAVARYSFDKDTRMNNGLMMYLDPDSRSGATSRIELQQLPPEVAKMVSDMHVGEISKPFVMIDKNTNRETCAIVRLRATNKSHRANLADDYQLLKNMTEGKQKAETINNWIAKKQKETYIRIDPQWQNCKFQYPGWIKK